MLQQTASGAFDRDSLTEGIGLKSCFTHLSMCDADTEVASRWYTLNCYRLSKVRPILPEAPMSAPTGPQRPAVHQKLQPLPSPGINFPLKYKCKVFYSNYCLNHCVNTLFLLLFQEFIDVQQASVILSCYLSLPIKGSGPTPSALMCEPSSNTNTFHACRQLRTV